MHYLLMQVCNPSNYAGDIVDVNYVYIFCCYEMRTFHCTVHL